VKAKDSCALESTKVQPWAIAFAEDIHVSSNSCKDEQACADTGSVSDEKSRNVQIHANLSKDLAGSLLDGVPPPEHTTPGGSLLDGLATDDEVAQAVGKLLTVRQVAKVLGVCPATVYRLCERGELAHYRVRHAIRVDITEVKAMLQRSSGSHHR
jgi:excisionase family DNA binding protein